MKIKMTEWRKKSKIELERILKDNRKKLQQLRFDLAAGKVKNVKEIRWLKKEIARILTLLNELTKKEKNKQ
ncbi:MAG: 50S ribosomal protein L29 [Minisyncoccales bacterium]